ncbi:hypothetical protein BE20_39450 [Sorangium cellulosum]|nr:hypothetical protein BE20_39450 [Sorangium cellulosum]
MAPRNTPVALPVSPAAGMPASSSASQLASSARRCCGSMCAASRGEMPKKAASKRSTSPRKPPARVSILPGAAGSGAW